jgi:XRE family aerobic/anaerobic benzoate catabolism transcriptional regulator
MPDATHADLLARLGGRVRSLRKAAGWTRRQLAERTGISERFLADVESGRANPSVVKLCELAATFGTDAATLLAPPAHSGLRHRTIALLGLRGAGKSSVGRELAARLDVPLVELDREIERATGLELGQMFELNGEGYFRRAERDVLRELLATRPDCVLATGGGLVTDPETWRMLRANAHTVWLRADAKDHWSRVVAQGDTRPMADHGGEAFAALCDILSEREPLYSQAEVVLDTSGRSVGELADELAGRFVAQSGST